MVTYNGPKSAEIHVIVLSSQKKLRIKDISFFIKFMLLGTPKIVVVFSQWSCMDVRVGP